MVPAGMPRRLARYTSCSPGPKAVVSAAAGEARATARLARRRARCGMRRKLNVEKG
jgi:hypothetical protein